MDPEPEPDDEVKQALFRLKYESMLQSAHPIIATNVTRGVAELLVLLGRPRLAEYWVTL